MLDRRERKRLDRVLSERWPHTRFVIEADQKQDKTEITWSGSRPMYHHVQEAVDNAGLWGPGLVSGLSWSRSNHLTL